MNKNSFKFIGWDYWVFLLMSLGGLSISVYRLQSQFSYRQRSLGSSVSSDWKQTALQGSVLDIGCVGGISGKVSFLRDKESVRIKGKVCGQGSQLSEIAQLKIINKSSGTSELIFIPKTKNQFMTGEIPLIKGNNIIRFEWQNSQGIPSKVQNAVVINQPS